jgi:DHA1 family bicyclomycin/chloramphenicol resistance-like MFS transporter
MKPISTIAIITLGAMSALGPLTTDMYVPALPAMTVELGATAAQIQQSVMAYFIGLAVGQLFYGPLSDRMGRKPVIYFALALFALASFGCVTATNGQSLTWWRMVQGGGASIGMVISIAIVRDSVTGQEALKLMGMISAILGIAPIVAPSIGAAIMHVSSWQAIFMLLGIVALVVLALAVFRLPETRSPELRRQSDPRHALSTYAQLLFRLNFIPYAATLALAQGAFFAYIAGSSFVMIGIFHQTPTLYALTFGANAIGLVAVIQFVPYLTRFISPARLVRIGCFVLAGASIVALLLQTSGSLGFWPFCILIFIAVASMGLIMPTCNVMAMTENGHIAGTAAALLGALGYGAGALASGMLAGLENGTAAPLLYVMAGSGALAALVALFVTDQEASSVEPAATH